MSSNNSIINLSFWFWESTVTHELRIIFVVSSKREEIVNISNFTEMRADGIHEDELEVDVSFNEIESRLVLTTVD